jgi:cytochrome d ubiquinol oxidase subunit I
MVAIGVLMILTGILAVYLLIKKKLFTSSAFHKWCVLMAPSGFIALLAGWITTEVGRQPYVVYGLMRTKDAASVVSVAQVSISLLVFVVAYSIVFSAGTFYIFKLINRGPLVGDWHDEYGTHGLKETPLTLRNK